MQQRVFFSNGKDQFKGNCFSPTEWSAPFLSSTIEVKEKLDSFHLIGKKVKGLCCLGHCNMDSDYYEEMAYKALSGLAEEERQNQSEIDNIPEDMVFPRIVEVEEPFLIEFDDHSQFEILVPYEGVFRMSANCLKNVGSAFGRSILADRFFDVCLGGTITDVDVFPKRTNIDPVTKEVFDDGKEREYVDSILIWLDNGFGFEICANLDFMLVSCLKKNGEEATITCYEVKQALDCYKDRNELAKMIDDKKVSQKVRVKVALLLGKALPSRKERCAFDLKCILRRENDEENLLAKIEEFAKVFFSETTDLYFACTSEYQGLSHVEEMLKKGVSSNGIVWDVNSPDNLYDVLVSELAGYESEDSYLPELTDLFLNYGLDIDNPAIPYDDCWITNPMWTLGLAGDAYLPTFAEFLKHGISAESVNQCIGHSVDDLLLVNVDVFDSEAAPGESDWFDDTVKKLMLVCSYPEIIEKLDWVRDLMDFDHNHYDVTKFRDYNNYSLSLDFSKCEKFPQPNGSIVTIIEKATQKTVWRFVFE